MQAVRSVNVRRGKQAGVLGSSLIVALGLYLCILHSPVGVSGHGYLIDPPSRSSEWRVGFNNPKNEKDNELFCGGHDTQWLKNGGKCGVCGDPWDAPQPRPNEVGGKYANGIIVRKYTMGQVVEMSVTITAQHGGWFEYRLCPHDNESTQAPTTQQCLDDNLLEVREEGGSRTRYQLASNATNGSFLVKVKLPEGLSCPHCVLQWKWRAGDRTGTGPDGVTCRGCGNQEEFVNCADISIISHTNSASPATLYLFHSIVLVFYLSLRNLL